MERPFSITLETPVGAICSRNIIQVAPEELATTIRRHMRERRARIALVVNRDGKLLGVISRGDLLVIGSRKSNARAKDLMSEPVVVLNYDTKIKTALKSMLRYDEWYAPVLSDGRVYGVFGLEHAIQRMIDEDPDYLKGVKVEEIMSRDVETVSPDDFVSNVWEKMRELRYAGLPVVDDKGRLVGIVTQHDILARGVTIARATSGGPLRGSRIREIMTPSVEYVEPLDPVLEAAKLIVHRGYGRIPVVEKKTRRLVGIVDREDIVRLALGGFSRR